MRLGPNIRAVVAAVLAVGSAAAWADDSSVWTNALSPNGQVSVETPCSRGQLYQLLQNPGDLTEGVNLPPSSRVLCSDGTYYFVAGVVEEPNLPQGSNLYDLLNTQLNSDPGNEGMPTSGVVNGRRATFNRQEAEGRIAQTGFVEVNPNRIVLVIAGFRAESGLTMAQQGQMIDRFCQSIQVRQP